MNSAKLKSDLGILLDTAGIQINGTHPWDIQVHNDLFYRRVLAEGSLGAGEAYVDGWWDCPRLDEFFTRVLKANLDKVIKANWKLFRDILLAKVLNRQTHDRAFQNGQRHYDLGNDLFRCMLDRRMTYTCGYWKEAKTLDEAQENKLDLTCRKLNLEPGMHVLDVGCGWGSFAKYAAEKFGVKVTGITVSKEQVELGQRMCAGLPVTIKLMDYRHLQGKFDCIVSLGMFEHVGHKNYRRFMEIIHRCLSDSGLFLLHTIGSNSSRTHTDPWLDRYIFPGSLIPSVKQIGQAIEGVFVMEDWHNFSADYDRTLMAWNDHFSRNREKLADRYEDSFFRMWTYYLLMCAATFRSRKNQLWQIVLSKEGVPGGYISIR